MVSAEVLREFIQLQLPLVEGPPRRYQQKGLRELARRHSIRYGSNERSAWRRLQRVMHKQDRVELNFADEMCVLFGRTLSEVYG